MKGCYVALFGTSSIYRNVIILVLVVIFAGSCDEVERHRVLTFFFDGVPPLGSEAGLDTPEVLPDPNSQPAERARPQRPQVALTIHEPQKDCTTCHGERDKRSFSAEVKLTAPVPQLCFDCHDGFAMLEGLVHGPVANGQCLMCHDPHKSRNEHLLKLPIKELCYFCHEHEAEVVASIPNHSKETYAKCDECHDGHASLERSLLRPGWQEKVE